MTGRFLVVSALVAAWTSAGCGGSSRSPSGPSAPVPPPAPSGAVFRVTLDAGSCRNVVSSAEVFLDGVSAGVIVPGDGGLSKTVSIGDHSFSASGRGSNVTWPTRTVNVGAAGHHALLTCNASTNAPPPPAPGPLPGPTPVAYGWLHLVLDGATCAGRANSATAYLDGRAVATLSVGSATPALHLLSGSYALRAESVNYTWPTTTITVPDNATLNFTFYCR